MKQIYSVEDFIKSVQNLISLGYRFCDINANKIHQNVKELSISAEQFYNRICNIHKKGKDV